MIYLDSITFPTEDAEWAYNLSVKRTCYNTMYPFGLLVKSGLESLDFQPLTILYGGNGSGKTTALNIIAEKLSVKREAPFNRSTFFDDYVKMCKVYIEEPIPAESRVITSDDVFEYMLDIRRVNQGIDAKREALFEDFYEARHSVFKVRSIDDYDELKKRNAARSHTQSSFVRGQHMENVREQSNGESSMFYFNQRMGTDALYLLDEPENSLSASGQKALAVFLQECVRMLSCQLIISTHSPFLLAMEGAKIYDLDARPVAIKKWHELDNVRAYYDLFREHADEF